MRRKPTEKRKPTPRADHSDVRTMVRAAAQAEVPGRGHGMGTRLTTSACLLLASIGFVFLLPAGYALACAVLVLA